MNINAIINQLQTNEIQVVDVQRNRDNRFVLIHITANDPQLTSIAALTNILESGVFALYNKNANRYDFTNKVWQEVEGISPSGSKVANLRKAILPVNDANDAIGTATLGELDDDQALTLKLAVAKLQVEAGLAPMEHTPADQKSSSKTATKSAPIVMQRPKDSKKAAKEVSANEANKQKPVSSKENEDVRSEEKAYRDERNQIYSERMEEEKAEAIKQKLAAYQTRQEFAKPKT